MLKYDVENKMVVQLEPTVMKSEEVKERYDLQETIVKSWEVFRKEIGLPAAYLIGDEINPHESTQDSIDILAYDPNDSSVVIIELKRDRNKLQLLQALTYAAMVRTWDAEKLVSSIKRQYYKDKPEVLEELIAAIKGNPLSETVQIILIAEFYDPEVIITADWLVHAHDLDITAFTVKLHKLEHHFILSTEQCFPLKALDEAYTKRGRGARRRLEDPPQADVDWDDIIPKLQYPFAARAVELCKKLKSGEPARRRFGSIRRDFDGFDWITVNCRAKYLNVYIGGHREDASKFLQSKFSEPIEISPWEGGVSFDVDTEKKFNDLVAWLKLE